MSLAELIAIQKVEILPENVPLIRGWLRDRGGVAVWYSRDLPSAGRSVLTPARQGDGTPYPRPHWQYPNQPDKVVTTEDGVEVLRIELKAARGRRKVEVYTHIPLRDYTE